MDEHHYLRFAQETLIEALQDTPVVLIHGSRQCGKTTLAKHVGERQGYHYLSFDDDNQLQAAQADPIGFIRDLPELVILDEIQRAPALFTSIKAVVDEDRRPGRFILTGSANMLLLPKLADSLAGRMEIIHLRPLAQCEIAGIRPSFLTRLFSGNFQNNQDPQASTRLGESLADVLVQGGYPAAIARSSAKRRTAWYRDYISTIVQRDLRDISNIQNLTVMPKLLAMAAGQTAHLFNATDLAAPFSISRPTISGYLSLLEQVFLIEQLQPWHSNRLSRLIKTPKLHVSDTGLASALLHTDGATLWQDKGLLGQLLETFVYQELRKQADWHDHPLNFYHFRNKDKVEVDIVIERGRQLAGVEVKASATVTKQDFHGLSRLRESLGDRFSGGVVLYDGDAVLSFGERLVAVPVSLLVAPPALAKVQRDFG